MTIEKFVLSRDVVEVDLGGRIAVYHRHLGALCMLDAAACRVMHGFKEPRALPPEWLGVEAPSREAELVQQLLVRRLIVPVAESAPKMHNVALPDKKVNIIQLILANACNFGCTYCFEGVQGKEMSAEAEYSKVDISRLTTREEIKVNINDSIYASKERFDHQYDPKNRHMKPEDAVSYVESALTVARTSGVREVMVQFFGGEPLLNWKAIEAVLDRFGNGERDHMTINYSTVTNGSLITDDIAQRFARNKVAVCVSFDSPTSPSRPLKNGEDSTPIVMHGLRLLQKYGNRVAINSALTSATWNEFDESIVDIAVEVGAGEIGVVVDFDPTFYSTFGTKNIVDRLWRVVEYGRTRGVVLTGYWHQIFQVLLGYDTLSERGFKNCSAKGAQFSIEPSACDFYRGITRKHIESLRPFEIATFDLESAAP